MSREGSIDWLCWPRFDSAACFAALLGGPEHGRWSIAPAAPQRSARRYRGDSLILETDFITADGHAQLVDFMPVGEEDSSLVRIVRGVSGRVRMRLDLTLRFDYGSSVPWVSRRDGGRLAAVAGPDMAVLDAPVPTHGEGLSTAAEFEVAGGQELVFSLLHAPSHRGLPPRLDTQAALDRTRGFWDRWSAHCTVEGRWADTVRRSLVTLKALTYAPTGGIVAAPTTSLPERIGGIRNWDYRYCWLRDATLTLLALMGAGYYEEAAAWREWLVRAVAGHPAQMQIMYGLAGERRLPEMELPWLPGYEGSAPVRIGNAAATQLQLDVFGEVMDALYQGRKGGLAHHDTAWELQRTLIGYLEQVMEQPDAGLWEVRGPARHFTYSKLMCWVALDRAIKSVERQGRLGDLARWKGLRARLHEEICRRGYDERRGAFVQSYGSHELDASLLLIPSTGLLPATDPRMLGTVRAIERELVEEGLVLRYRTEHTDDGLPPGEGCFLACSFWLADNYLLQGERGKAVALFERLLELRNDVGLLAEQYDPYSRRALGNFPQAFSHVGLVNTALNLGERHKPASERGE